MDTLATKIRDRILSHGEPIAFDSLMKRGEALGVDRRTMLEAMRAVHKMKSIRTTNRLGTIYYDPMPIHEVVMAPRVDRSSYPVMDATNDCHHEIFEGLDFSQLFLTPEEVRVLEYTIKQQRERDLRDMLKDMEMASQGHGVPAERHAQDGLTY